MLKKILFLFLICLVFYAKAQPGSRENDPVKKLEQLEKVKIIEVLNMNEETTIKFFHRRKAFKERQHDLNERLDRIISDLDNKSQSGQGGQEAFFSAKIAEMQRTNIELAKSKEDYINSLFEILPASSVAKLIVFEKRFKEEVRDMLFKEKNRRFRGGGD